MREFSEREKRKEEMVQLHHNLINEKIIKKKIFFNPYSMYRNPGTTLTACSASLRRLHSGCTQRLQSVQVLAVNGLIYSHGCQNPVS